MPRQQQPINEVFGRRLRKLRQARSLTQERLGQQANVGYKHLGEIERGETSPSFEMVERLATVLNVPYATFFLPDTVDTMDKASEISRLAERADQLDPATVRTFLEDLAQAVRRLDRNRTP